MPHQTFFNLPEEKRQTLIDCALDEFAARDYDSASISQIVARADEGHSLADFVAMQGARGKARITLVADVAGEAGPATTLRARFVSKRKAEDPA